MDRKVVYPVLVVFGLSFTTFGFSQIAFLGDSIATGAAAHKNLSFDRKDLLGVFTGRNPLTPSQQLAEELASNHPNYQKLLPIRLAPHISEFRSPLDWVGLNLLSKFSARYLDVEEHSWATILAGLMGEAAIIAAEDGARSEAARKQARRILHHTGGHAPAHSFLLFTGNDLCSPFIEGVTESEDYSDHLRKAVLQLADSHRGALPKQHIWLVAPLGIMQISQSKAIGEKLVPGPDGEVSCKELQQSTTQPAPGENGAADELLYLSFFPASPRAYCPSLMGGGGDGSDDYRFKIANRLRSYQEALPKLAESLGEELPDNVSVGVLHSPAKLVFDADHIANDCLHLSLAGQKHLAETLWDELQNQIGNRHP